MTIVREATFELLRRHGITTMFGNPGSTELPMLADFPDDFRYVLALQEAVVVGMADGFAQASGTVGHANLHTAPGVGNAVGALFNAQANKAPLLVTAGQQVRAHMTMQANLTNRDAVVVGQPYLKWAYEPPRAADVPAALERAIHTASLAPCGPAFVSIPMDDWGEEATPVPPRIRRRPCRRRRARARRSHRRGALARACRRTGRRRLWRLARGGRPRRAGALVGLGDARAGRRPHRLPGGPSAVPRPARPGARPGGRDARRARPGDRRRLVRLPLLPLHPGAAAEGGHGARGDHERSRRGGPRTGRRRDRGRRRAHPRGARAGCGGEPAIAAARARRAARGRAGHRRRGARRARRTAAGGRRHRPRGAQRDARAAQPAAHQPAQARTSSVPAAAWASAWRARSACRSACPTGRWSASSARARRSTRSPASGPQRRTACRSRSWSCATPSTRSSSGSRGWRA